MTKPGRGEEADLEFAEPAAHRRPKEISRRQFMLMLSLAGAAAACGGGDAEMAAEWGYSGAAAPGAWAGLSSEYEDCGSGDRQSPIDITGYAPGDPPPLRFSYGAAPVRLTNNGRAVYINYEEGSRFEFAGRSYELQQAHYHTPSEHLLDGESFAAELHLVHRRSSGGLAVVGFLFRLGDPDPFLEEVLNLAPAVGGSADAADASLAGLNSSLLVPEERGFYMYEGSTTTPPCTESVEWFVMAQTGTASAEQVERWRAATAGGPTNRPVQPRNGREIVFTGSRR